MITLKLSLAILGLTVAATAYASFLGTLVSSQQGTSVTGRLVWECTYNVLGSYQTVTLSYMCPISMQFE